MRANKDEPQRSLVLRCTKQAILEEKNRRSVPAFRITGHLAGCAAQARFPRQPLGAARTFSASRIHARALLRNGEHVRVRARKVRMPVCAQTRARVAIRVRRLGRPQPREARSAISACARKLLSHGLPLPYRRRCTDYRNATGTVQRNPFATPHRQETRLRVSLN